MEERQLLLTRIDRDLSETAAERKRNRLAIAAKEKEVADAQWKLEWEKRLRELELEAENNLKEEIKQTKAASRELKKQASSREEAHFKSRQEITDLVGGRVSEQMKNAHRRSALLLLLLLIFFGSCVVVSLLVLFIVVVGKPAAF